MRILLRTIPMAAALLAATAAAQTRVDLPPHEDRAVYDLADVITTEHEQTMERSHRELREKTGVAIAVVVWPRLEGEALEDVLAKAESGWGLGREAGDRGIVVALAMEEHRVLIATGHGVEDFLPDERVRMIIRRFIIPRLQRNEVSFAMLHASGALIAAASERYAASVDAPKATSDTRRVPARSGMAAFVVVLFVLALAVRPLAARLRARQ
jgi:uncharacterized membrane protein YgcG